MGNLVQVGQPVSGIGVLYALIVLKYGPRKTNRAYNINFRKYGKMKR